MARACVLRVHMAPPPTEQRVADELAHVVQAEAVDARVEPTFDPRAIANQPKVALLQGQACMHSRLYR